MNDLFSFNDLVLPGSFLYLCIFLYLVGQKGRGNETSLIFNSSFCGSKDFSVHRLNSTLSNIEMKDAAVTEVGIRCSLVNYSHRNCDLLKNPFHLTTRKSRDRRKEAMSLKMFYRSMFLYYVAWRECTRMIECNDVISVWDDKLSATSNVFCVIIICAGNYNSATG